MIIVSDHEKTGNEPWIVGGMPVDFQSVTEFQSRADEVIVIDVDMRNRKTVARLSDRLGRISQPGLIACAIDPNSYSARADAIIMGATKFLPQPLVLDDLESIAQQSADLAAAPVTALHSVDTASDVLGRTFRALSGEGNLKVDEMLGSGDEILGSIKSDGMQTWLSVVRARHEGTFQHCLIVTGLVTNFAMHWGMNQSDIDKFSTAGLLHDIGKVRIPNEILDKPGKLTDAEFAVIKTHPVVGYDYLLGQKGMTDDLLSAVRHHHEALDGSGYPDGLKGSEIDDLTRILSICDVYGAMIEHRPYKKQALPQDAMAVLLNMANDNKLELSLVKAFAKTVDVVLN